MQKKTFPLVHYIKIVENSNEISLIYDTTKSSHGCIYLQVCSLYFVRLIVSSKPDTELDL